MFSLNEGNRYVIYVCGVDLRKGLDEFGNKVSIIRSATGVILGACSFRNE